MPSGPSIRNGRKRSRIGGVMLAVLAVLTGTIAAIIFRSVPFVIAALSLLFAIVVSLVWPTPDEERASLPVPMPEIEVAP